MSLNYRIDEWKVFQKCWSQMTHLFLSHTHKRTLCHGTEPRSYIAAHYGNCKRAPSGDSEHYDSCMQVLHWDAFSQKLICSKCIFRCCDVWRLSRCLLLWCCDVIGWILLFLFPTKANSGSLAGILCAIGVAAVGAVTGYFTYQRKQLCFKNRQGNYLADHLTHHRKH